jgi:hypothetical protein
MFEIQLGSATGSGSVANPYLVTPFTVDRTEVRQAIKTQNAKLCTLNGHLRLNLRQIVGTETDSEMERIYLDNYFKTMAALNCNLVLAGARVTFGLLGYITGSLYCFSVERFIAGVCEDIMDDLRELCELLTRPANPTFRGAATFVQGGTSKFGLFRKVAASGMRVGVDRLEGGFIKEGLKAFATIVQGGVDTWLIVYSSPTLDALLTNPPPNADTAGYKTGADVAVALMEARVRSCATAAEARRAQAAGAPRPAPAPTPPAGAAPQPTQGSRFPSRDQRLAAAAAAAAAAEEAAKAKGPGEPLTDPTADPTEATPAPLFGATPNAAGRPRRHVADTWPDVHSQ